MLYLIYYLKHCLCISVTAGISLNETNQSKNFKQILNIWLKIFTFVLQILLTLKPLVHLWVFLQLEFENSKRWVINFLPCRSFCTLVWHFWRNLTPMGSWTSKWNSFLPTYRCWHLLVLKCWCRDLLKNIQN